MPQLFSQSSTNYQNKQDSIISSTPERPSGPSLKEYNKYDEEEDDAVTPKKPRVLGRKEITTSEDSTAAEEIGVVTPVKAAHFGRDLALCPPTVTLAPSSVHAPPEAWAEPT